MVMITVVSVSYITPPPLLGRHIRAAGRLRSRASAAATSETYVRYFRPNVKTVRWSARRLPWRRRAASVVRSDRENLGSRRRTKIPPADVETESTSPVPIASILARRGERDRLKNPRLESAAGTDGVSGVTSHRDHVTELARM